MNTEQTINLSLFAENPDNPSVASDDAIARLMKKLRKVPEGLTASRIAYVTDYVTRQGVSMAQWLVVLSGNKRLRVLKEIYGESADVPASWFQDVTNLTPPQRRVFLVAANVVEGEWDAALMRELYSEAELAPLMGDDALDSLLSTVSSSVAADSSAAEAETVELAITLPAEDYRRAYVALVSRNEDISKAFMEFINERT